MPNWRAQGGCGAEPAGLTNAIILSRAKIEKDSGPQALFNAFNGCRALSPTFCQHPGSIDSPSRNAGMLNVSPAVPSLPTPGE